MQSDQILHILLHIDMCKTAFWLESKLFLTILVRECNICIKDSVYQSATELFCSLSILCVIHMKV